VENEENRKVKTAFEDAIKKIVVIVVLVLLVISLWGVYSSLNDLIGIWVGYKYAPIYKTLLNLAVLILATYVLRLLIKKE